MDFIKNKTAKLRNLGKSLVRRLLTRKATNRIAPAPVAELAALDPTEQPLSPRLASLDPKEQPLSPRRVSLSPTTKVVTDIQNTFRKRKRRTQTLANLSKLNSERRATRRIQKKFRKALENPNLEECSICYNTMLYPRFTKTLRCGHKFHKKCIEQWNATNPSCPLCRASIEPERPYHQQRSISMPISSTINNANIVSRVNTLIAELPNAADTAQAINLLNEIEAQIYSLPHSERVVPREALNQVWPRTYALLQEAPRQSRATSDAINSANALIDNMSHATTFDEATRFMDDSRLVINSLPRNGDAYRVLADRQWVTWLQAYSRLSAPIQTRAPITVNGITTADYNRNRSRANVQPITVNGITTTAYNRNRSRASVQPITVNRSTQLDTHPDTGITPADYDRLVRGMY